MTDLVIFREVEDRDLIAQACRGEVEAYNILVSRWEKRVFNYLLRLVGHREDALDLTQDVMLKGYQNLRKLDDADRFDTCTWRWRLRRRLVWHSCVRSAAATRSWLARLNPCWSMRAMSYRKSCGDRRQ